MTKHFLSSKRQVRAWLICSCIFLGRVISQISLCYFHKKIISCIILLVRKDRRSNSALFGDSKKWWCTHNQITFEFWPCEKKYYLQRKKNLILQAWSFYWVPKNETLSKQIVNWKGPQTPSILTSQGIIDFWFAHHIESEEKGLILCWLKWGYNAKWGYSCQICKMDD